MKSQPNLYPLSAYYADNGYRLGFDFIVYGVITCASLLPMELVLLASVAALLISVAAEILTIINHKLFI